MRNALFSELLSLFREDSRIVFMTGDLGYKLFDPLVEVDPERVINFGLRETGMVGFAAGLAKTGMLPFVYSIVPFITLRCLEQIKLDLCYNRSHVLLVGVGSGFSYGPNASSHYGIDDIGVLGVLPGLRVWTPADSLEVRACVRSFPKIDEPAYLRLGRTGEPLLHSPEKGLPPIDHPVIVRKGSHGTIVTCGTILHEVLNAIDTELENEIHPQVVHIPTIRPFPTERLSKILFLDSSPILSVEEHVSVGGLGQEVATLVARTRKGNPFQMLSIPPKFPDTCFDRKAALTWAGLDEKTIAETYRQLVTES